MNITDEQRASWVKALRSGKYAQGKKKLKFIRGEGTYYCCLGVLLDTLGDRGKLTESMCYDFGYHTATLPQSFKNTSGYFFDPLTYNIRALSDLNDDYGFSFDDIAKIVETCQFVEG